MKNYYPCYGTVGMRTCHVKDALYMTSAGTLT